MIRRKIVAMPFSFDGECIVQPRFWKKQTLNGSFAVKWLRKNAVHFAGKGTWKRGFL
jgi:hypothetical protein